MAVQTWTRRPLKSRETVWAARLARWLVVARLRPNQISLGSVVAAGIAGFCLLRGWYIVAAVFIQLRLLCNLLDGMVAIEGGCRSASGDIYNDLPDRVSDALILVAAGYASTWPAWSHELGWSAALLAILTAYTRILGGACGLPQDFGGPMAKPHRMAVMTAACLLALADSRVLAVGLMIVAVGSLATVALRIRRIVQRLEASAR